MTLVKPLQDSPNKALNQPSTQAREACKHGPKAAVSTHQCLDIGQGTSDALHSSSLAQCQPLCGGHYRRRCMPVKTADHYRRRCNACKNEQTGTPAYTICSTLTHNKNAHTGSLSRQPPMGLAQPTAPRRSADQQRLCNRPLPSTVQTFRLCPALPIPPESDRVSSCTRLVPECNILRWIVE